MSTDLGFWILDLGFDGYGGRRDGGVGSWSAAFGAFGDNVQLCLAEAVEINI
jgi:hypothetical protein